jgi:cardiolipin synthase A/B
LLTTALTIGEIVYVLVVVVWVVMEKRPPASTVAWILALAALPGVGLLLYFVLGPRRVGRERSRRARAQRRIRASLPNLHALSDVSRAEGQMRQLMALALNNSESPLSSGNAVRILRNGTECFPALEEAIRGAQHHIHLEYYIFDPDETGTKFRDLLVERAKAGVQVRLLVDAIGSSALGPSFFKPLLDAGGEAAFFNRVRLLRLVRPLVNFRSHRKIVVVDGQIGFTGGLNIADEYAGLVPENVVRDTHVRIAGPAVRALQLLFLEDWNFATDKSLTEPRLFADVPEQGDAMVQIVGSGPDKAWRAIQQVYFSAVTQANDRLLISTPYFVPDPSIATALCTAALRGVDVQLLLPRRADSRVGSAAARSYYDDLLAAGVRIFEYLPGFMHAKTVVVDRKFASVGSANFNSRSFSLDFEVNALLYSPQLAGELEDIFKQDLTVSKEVTAESRQTLGFFGRLGEGTARLLSPLL